MAKWRPVVGWEGSYEVSDSGEVRSLPRKIVTKTGTVQNLRGKVLKPRATPKGHLYVQLSANSKPRGKSVHSLVMEAFVGPRPEGQEVCHNDGNPANNRLENLRYDTHSSNGYDSVAHGVHPNAIKTHCKRGHRFDENNTITRKWRDSTHRRCRACMTVMWNHRGIPVNSPEFSELADHYYRINQKGNAHV